VFSSVRSDIFRWKILEDVAPDEFHQLNFAPWMAGLIALLVFNVGNWAIIALAVVKLVTNSEIIAMHLIAQSPPVDVPCIFALPKQR
jgi:hypothetical protein